MLNVLSEKQIEETISKPVGSNAEVKRMEAWLEERISKGRKSPIAEVVTLTPVLASLLLQRNPANRNISKANKSDIKQDVASGRYVFNGESVIVSDTGILNDGQHRCLTVVETGVSIQTVIVFGPKEDTRFTVDSGKSKSVANFLAMKGRKYVAALGPASGYVLQWKQHGRLYSGSDVRPSKQEILAAADNLKGIDSSVEFSSPCTSTVRNHALLSFCHYAFWKSSSREAADHFISRLIEGDGLKKGDPILFCRNKLISMGRYADAGTKAELMFKCWNAHRDGSTVAAFRSTGGKLPKLER